MQVESFTKGVAMHLKHDLPLYSFTVNEILVRIDE
jgi:hypothetical protein